MTWERTIFIAKVVAGIVAWAAVIALFVFLLPLTNTGL